MEARRAPDIDGPRVTRWLQERVEIHPPLDFRVVTGGRSNLTYVVTDAGGRRLVLRRPPLDAVLESAHDMGREYRLIAALSGTDVPVPPAIDYEPTGDMTGAPFFVMDFVAGEVIRDEDSAREKLRDHARRAVAHDLVDVLARIHAVDPHAAGLGDLGRREDYVGRQLRRWQRQLAKTQTRDLPILAHVHDRLAAAVPEQQDVVIVHGDYRLENLIVDATAGRVRAVLDWELATLGDPLADVGLLLLYWAQPDDSVFPLGRSPALAGGFPGRDELAQRYVAGTGRDFSTIGYYIAFAAWRLACILEGVYSRYASGAYGETDDSFTYFGDVVPQLGELARTVLDRRGVNTGWISA